MNITKSKNLNKYIGTHIIGDLYDCDLSHCENYPKKDVVKIFNNLILSCNLNPLGNHIHYFEEGGFTLIIALAESHIAVHTWPEINYVSLDVFVCNYSKNNTSNAKKLFKQLCDLFCSKNISSKIVKRRLK